MAAYLEHAPPSALAPFVECFWTSESDAAGAHRVLPDGCVDLLFDLASERDGIGSVIGTMTRPLDVPPAARVRIAAVRFRPGAAWRLLDRPVSEITDARVRLDELWPEVARLEDALRSEGRPADRVALLADELERRVPAARHLDVVANAAVQAIGRAPERFSITAFSARLGVSRQHLTRRFKQAVGIGPKRFARVRRMQRVLTRLQGPTPGSIDWSALALEHGYADQSHLGAELLELTGRTPTQWFR